MKNENIVILDYCIEPVDNFVKIAYAKILETDKNIKCFYENETSKRNNLEKQMEFFDFDFNYLSKKRIQDVTSCSFFKFFPNKNKFFNKCVKNNMLIKDKFDINDAIFLKNNIKNFFNFKKLDFIKNFDILDDILHSNSIGVFLSAEDKLNKNDVDFLLNSILRLNKFLKKPKLFIFTRNRDFSLDTFIEYIVVDIFDWKEMYYFLSCCKNHIILDSENSYSLNFWSACLIQEGYVVYRKQNANKSNHNHASMPVNWLSV